MEPVGPSGSQEKGGLGCGGRQRQGQGGDQKQRQGRDHHARGVVPGKAGDEVLAGGLLLAGVFHQVQNLRDCGLPALPGDFHPEKARLVDAAADDRVAGDYIPGNGFAGEGGSVQGGGTLHHHAVQGHPLAGLDHHNGAHGHLLRVHLLDLAVLPFQVGGVGPDIHESGNRLPGLAHGVVLEQLSHLVEEHHEDRLRVFPGAEGPHCGKSHQEILVKDLAVGNVAQGPGQHIPSDDEIGHEIEKPGGQGKHRAVLGGRAADQRKVDGQTDLWQQLHHHQQHRRGQNPGQHLFLLLAHGDSSQLQVFEGPPVPPEDGREGWSAGQAADEGSQKSGGPATGRPHPVKAFITLEKAGSSEKRKMADAEAAFFQARFCIAERGSVDVLPRRRRGGQEVLSGFRRALRAPAA